MSESDRTTISRLLPARKDRRRRAPPFARCRALDGVILHVECLAHRNRNLQVVFLLQLVERFAIILFDVRPDFWIQNDRYVRRWTWRLEDSYDFVFHVQPDLLLVEHHARALAVRAIHE